MVSQNSKVIGLAIAGAVGGFLFGFDSSVVNGAIVAIIGFNLAPSVWNNFKVAPDTAIVTLVAINALAKESPI